MIRKAAKATCQFLGDKIADAVAKWYDDKIVKPDENQKNVEEKIVPPEKRKKMLNGLRQFL